MNRNRFGLRGIPYPGQFVRSIDYYYSTLLHFSRPTEQPGCRGRKIFVIKESIRPLPSRGGQALPATGRLRKAIQHILVYDDHPDSLRLVLGCNASPQANRAGPQNARWWEPVLGGMLILGAFAVIFLPLFLKLPS
jgi:hypothetical protein